jgi:hypothetical protein
VAEPRDPSLDLLLELTGRCSSLIPRAATGGEAQDHRHRLRTIKAYDYRDAATLLGDFWTMVDTVLRERGVLP